MKELFGIDASLAHLTQKGFKFEWTKDCDQNFQELKRWLVSIHILTISIKNERFTIYNDASRKGLGYVLLQHGKVVAYASK